MICQKPRNFRLSAKALGNTAADLGSNDREFWFWISKNEPPYLYHCSYEDYARGVRMPLPFQPDWIVEALGVGEYDPAKNYRVVPSGAGVDLVEETTSQGQPVRKITRLARGRNYQWQVVGAPAARFSWAGDMRRADLGRPARCSDRRPIASPGRHAVAGGEAPNENEDRPSCRQPASRSAEHDDVVHQACPPRRPLV